MIFDAVLALLLALATFLLATVRVRPGVLRMLRTRPSTMITDNGRGAWTVTWASLWVGRMSDEWRERYGSTWACGDDSHAWYYYPTEGKRDGTED